MLPYLGWHCQWCQTFISSANLQTKQTDTAKSATPKSDGNRGSMSVSSVLSEDNKVGVKIPDFTGTLQCAMLHNSRHLAPAITIEVKSARTSFASSLDDADFMYRLKKAACLLEASTTRPSKDSTPEVNQDLQPLLVCCRVDGELTGAGSWRRGPDIE